MRTVTRDASSTDVVMWVAVMSVGAQSKLGIVGVGSMNASSARREATLGIVSVGSELMSGIVGVGNMKASSARCGKYWGLARVRRRVLFTYQREDHLLGGDRKAGEDPRRKK